MATKDLDQLSFASVVNKFDTTNTNFLIYQCGWERNAPNKTPIHGSRTFALHYIVSGEVIIEYKERKYILTEGTCFLLRPGRSMVYYPNPENPASYYWFSVTGGIATAFFDNMGFSTDNFYFELPEDHREKMKDTFFRAMTLGRENKNSSHIFLYKGFYEICEILTILIAEHSPKVDSSPFLSVTMSKALEHIQDNYADPNFSLQLLAKRLGYNPSYLSRLFKKELGMNFKTYIVQKRMHHAAILMRQGESNAGVIAEKVGIRDAAYFRRLYKKTNSDVKVTQKNGKNSKK